MSVMGRLLLIWQHLEQLYVGIVLLYVTLSYSIVCSLLANEGGEVYVSYTAVNCSQTCKGLNHRGVGYSVFSVNTYHCVGLPLQGDN